MLIDIPTPLEAIERRIKSLSAWRAQIHRYKGCPTVNKNADTDAFEVSCNRWDSLIQEEREELRAELENLGAETVRLRADLEAL